MLNNLIDKWIETGDDTELVAYMDTPEYYTLPYVERNARFITQSKLKAYERCPLFAKMEHIDGIEKPEGRDDGQDHFIVGQAFEDLVMFGEKAFNERYEVVARRSESNKIQLTNTMGNVVRQMSYETMVHPCFPKAPKKVNILWLAFGKYPCKAELDNIEPDHFGDFKTCANITAFEENFFKYGYDIQAEFYYSGLLEKMNLKLPCRFYVTDKHKWARSHVWEYSVQRMQEGQARIHTLIQNWVNSLETGMWRAPDINNAADRKVIWDSPYYGVFKDSRTNSPTKL